ncbi:MAG: cytochrome b/b6 domain-containing protein [Halodesulfurarchaeum sp.]
MGIRNIDIIGATNPSPGRTTLAALISTIGTVGLFWSVIQLQLVSGTWTLTGRLVTVHFPFRVYDVIWFVARIVLGLYISFVVLVISLQLLGSWRQMTAEKGTDHGSEKPPVSETAEDGSTTVLARFNDVQVYAHGIIALSILLLWVTGLPLTFNDALGWVYTLLGGHTAIVVHGVVGGVLILTVMFYLIYGFMGIITGETTLRHIRPGLEDVKEGYQHVLYLLGRGEEPDSGKYTVLQKAESWIIVFEAVVMMWTGLMLWSATFTTQSPFALDTLMTQWPAPFMLILRDVHAIVGVTMLAGITFHLFMTHVKEWPLDTSIFTGGVGLGRASEEWKTWAEERIGRSDFHPEEYTWQPALTLGAIVGMGVFSFVWLGAVLQYTLAPLPTGGLRVLGNISPAGLPGGWLGVLFSFGLNLAFLVVLLAIFALGWGFWVRWNSRGV